MWYDIRSISMGRHHKLFFYISAQPCLTLNSRCKCSSRSELSIGCFIIFPHHLPHLLPPSLSVHLLPLCLFYAQNKWKRAHGCRGDTGDATERALDHACWNLFYTSQQQQRSTCEVHEDELVCSHELNVSPGFNVAHGGLRRSVFHVKVGLMQVTQPRDAPLVLVARLLLFGQSARSAMEIFSI